MKGLEKGKTQRYKDKNIGTIKRQNKSKDRAKTGAKTANTNTNATTNPNTFNKHEDKRVDNNIYSKHNTTQQNHQEQTPT
jgi:hypothetical protein